MPVSCERVGAMPDGVAALAFVLTNAAGAEVRLLSYGATLVGMRVPDRHGRPGDVVLGFDSWQRYLGPHPHLGGIVGRFANRIAGSRFQLEGREHRLAANEPPHHLHGGVRGFDRCVWRAEPVSRGEGAVVFQLVSPDGGEGYPGALEVRATYVLSETNVLGLELEARCDRATVVNLTQHAYYHLGDGGASPVLGHELWLDSDRFLEVDPHGIPTGAVLPVEGGPLDFRTPRGVGERIQAAPGGRSGYDHCLVLRRPAEPGGAPVRAARLRDPESGRSLELWCTQPALQLYAGNFLDGSVRGRGGVAYHRHHALCLEPEHFPDAPNQGGFPSTVLRPGERYSHRIELHFHRE
jgi:aldose 1-epimerase